jgi:hypothetical protein
MENKEFKNTHEVIQPEIKFNTDWMVKEVPAPTEPSEFEKKLLEGTLKPEQLLKKEQEEKEQEEKEKEELLKKDLIQKVKVLALDRCGFYPLSNPSEMTQNEKNKIIKKMDRILKKNTIEKITENFNIIIQALLIDGNTDYNKLPRKMY